MHAMYISRVGVKVGASQKLSHPLHDYIKIHYSLLKENMTNVRYVSQANARYINSYKQIFLK